MKKLELDIRSLILSVAQDSKSKAQEFEFKEQESKSKVQKSNTKVQVSKTKYKESKILLNNSKYWQIHIVSLTPWAIYQNVSKEIFLLRIHFPLLENANPFQLVPGCDPRHTLVFGGQEPHKRIVTATAITKLQFQANELSTLKPDFPPSPPSNDLMDREEKLWDTI
ncbi:hypothetical protein DSO57_1035974 [Entomophthora muscae]|uniref:Uncharacterized protein n=1 Tax=Entomophthora muscae TaxID=34485 RepID=A0ACC2RE25_9FUNG|nr:hypothetical protein DSO57_1035974 [Entomophthora muscae]